MREAPTFDVDRDRDYAAVLAHYLDKHPTSSRLREVICGTVALVPCAACGAEFRGAVRPVAGRLVTAAYCPDCEPDQYLAELLAQFLTPSEYIDRREDRAVVEGTDNA
jgi:hypothetical protein